jgi:ssDNA thymidine ADP-ribosyltransferase, DarT
MAYFRDSGFVSVSQAVPQRDQPRDWLVWHFTHLNNLRGIAEANCLRCQNQQTPTVSVALSSVKERRRSKLVNPDQFYPTNRTVADHVPFYMAAKSPMLYAVTRGHFEYSGGDESLVFLGLTIGAIVDSGVTWCASDSNAACDIVRFSRVVSTLGSLVDFDLLCRERWNKTPDDQDRPSRRAAEVLVLDQVPLTMITHVVAKTQVTLDRARSILDLVGGLRQYHLEPGLYYN